MKISDCQVLSLISLFAVNYKYRSYKYQLTDNEINGCRRNPTNIIGTEKCYIIHLQKFLFDGYYEK